MGVRGREAGDRGGGGAQAARFLSIKHRDQLSSSSSSWTSYNIISKRVQSDPPLQG